MNETTKLVPGTETFTLLIWEEIPEYVKLVLVPNAIYNEELWQLFKDAHGAYEGSIFTNEKQQKAILNLQNALSKKEHYFADPLVDEKWNGFLVNFIVDDGVISENPPAPIEQKIITAAYKTGWFL